MQLPITGSSWLLICIALPASSLFYVAAVSESRGWIPYSMDNRRDSAAAAVDPAADKGPEELALLISWHGYACHPVRFYEVTSRRAGAEGGRES
jgi:hypothetical protein